MSTSGPQTKQSNKKQAGKQNGQSGAAPTSSQEIELKFTLPAATLRALAKDGLAWPEASAPASKPLLTRYYDTPSHLFWRHGIALRIRRKGEQWLQHLKWRGLAARSSKAPALAGGSVRTEWEWPLANSQPDTALIEQALDGMVRLPKKWGKKLSTVFETDLTRAVQTLTTSDGSVIELAFDFGVVRTGATERILAEVELELVTGNANALYEVADRLVTQTRARLAGGSKAEQGYRLALSKPPSAVKSTAAPLHRDDSGWRALQAQAGQTLQDLLANQAVVLADSSPEGVHQMRVALRRLDAIVRPLETALAGHQTDTLLAELRWLRRSLGHLRNWGVFLTETLPRLKNPAHGKLLRPAADAMRADAHKAMILALNDHSYADLLLKLAQLADGAPPFDHWSPTSQTRLNRPFRGLAARWFIETMTAMQSHSEKLATMSPAKQHRFRLKVKKTRYIAELLIPIDIAKPLKKTARHMAALQDGLGEQNDAFTALELLDAMAKHPVTNHDVDAAEAIASEHKALHRKCHKPVPQIAEQWQRIAQSFDDWLMASRQ